MNITSGNLRSAVGKKIKMNITRVPGPSGPGPAWGHQHQGLDNFGSAPFHGGFFSRFLYNFCTTITTCAYFVCCCWLLRDCFSGPREGDFGQPPPPPRPSYGTWAPAPPQPPVVMPGQPGQPAPPGPPGGPVERPFY